MPLWVSRKEAVDALGPLGRAWGAPPLTLTGVCKSEIIATNRLRNLWIPAYAGMMEWDR